MAAIPRVEPQQIIDPHIHLFNLREGDYHWLKPGNEPNWPDKSLLYRDCTEQDLVLTPPLSLAGFVHVEAGFDNQAPWREIAWLEGHCRKPFRSIGYLDLQARDAAFHLARLAPYPSVVGVRDILDQRATILLKPQVQANLALLASHGWLFEAQLFLDDADGVNALCETLRRQPDLRVIINHGGFPPTGSSDKWLAELDRLASQPCCAIKCSGWEMTNRRWSIGWARACLYKVLERFGQHRVMLASNFPLCTLSLSLNDLWQSYVSEFGLNPGQVEALCYRNAKSWYHLETA